MSAMMIVCCGVFISVSVFLLLERSILSKVLGILLLSSVVNIILLVCGRLQNNMPAFVDMLTVQGLSNPLPQALILTAIVIGFGLIAFLCFLLCSK
jgi:multicomponent Na+:H+ antiporter subunit C